MPDRKEQLVAMLAKNADDIFLRFALAMECVKRGETEQALTEFGRVLALDSGYIAAYAQKALVHEQLRQFDDAKRTYHTGIESANAKGDRHAASKMQEALDRLIRVTG